MSKNHYRYRFPLRLRLQMWRNRCVWPWSRITRAELLAAVQSRAKDQALEQLCDESFKVRRLRLEIAVSEDAVEAAAARIEFLETGLTRLLAKHMHVKIESVENVPLLTTKVFFDAKRLEDVHPSTLRFAAGVLGNEVARALLATIDP